ncbi:hypothetical protein VKT23_008590 [Stygiomarasmius scandens]|uniref:Uncharacterized protein n=1 Tax=Marasmiellus scandens TaxID=2682957 RepID=A0ABR1JK54_9AGAR
MDENGAEDERQLDRDEDQSSDSGLAGSNALAMFSSSQGARISTLESAQSELTAELDEKNARISCLRSLLNETAAYQDKLEHDLALLQIQSTKQLADAREEAKQQKEELQVRDEHVKVLKGELVEVRERLDGREKVDNESKAKTDALEGALQKKQVSVQELAASNGALQKELVEAKETTEKDMEQKEQQIREMGERINFLEDALSVTKESLDEKASTLDKAVKGLLETKSAFEREMDQGKDAFRTELAEKDQGITIYYHSG